MLPDMADVLDEFSQPITLSRITQTIVGHRPVDTATAVSIMAVVQPAQKDKINSDIIDWNLAYYQVHSKQAILVNDQMLYQGTNYKAVELAQYGDYGYYEALFEQIK